MTARVSGTGAVWRTIVALVALAALLGGALLAFAEARPAHADLTLTVNTNGDGEDINTADGVCDASSRDGQQCTLRAAIQQANSTAGADTIAFNIPGGGAKTIAPNFPLPEITDPVTIDGYTQPGAKANTKAVGSDAVLLIELSGANAGEASGLRIGAANSTVRGLVINRWYYNGVVLDGTGNEVQGNFIGTDITGTQDLGNYYEGVWILFADDNTVGGTEAAARNVISGNRSGVNIYQSATDNRVQGNYIGTDASGTRDLGNSSEGVFIEGDPYDSWVVDQDAFNNTVGGTEAGARNIISGNGNNGVLIDGLATNNKVKGNYVGTDATGTKDLGNSGSGVDLPSDTTVGGTEAGARNVISGNGGAGVVMYGGDNRVQGNYIGTNAAGTQRLGNSGDGVYAYSTYDTTIGGTEAGARNVISGNDGDGVHMHDGANKRVQGNYIGTNAAGTQKLGNVLNGVVVEGRQASNNTVGGTETAARNVISGNGGDGVVVRRGPYDDRTDPVATRNRILSNSIHANGGLGINLKGGPENAYGVTRNDAGDADTGPNGLQNYPSLDSATTSSSSGTTTIRGKLYSTPNTRLTLQFFSSPASDPSGFGEGRQLVGQRPVTTGSDGSTFFTFTSAQGVQAGQYVTATATSPSGDTSEFSEARRVVSGS